MLFCIGGVCVPYTAVIPIIVLALKWVAVKLAGMGLLPKAVADALSVPQSATTEKACCEKTSTVAAQGPVSVRTMESEEDFNALLKKENHKIVCKFTACWCKPCHKIQPFFESLSSRYDAKTTSFVTIDVDDLEGIASKYKVAMMPTFVIVEGEKVLGKYSGSSEPELETFLQQHL